MNDYALEIKELTKKYSDFTLDNISFGVEKGCVMGLVGQNGAGKTTCIKLILNAIAKQSGKINIYGMDNIEREVQAKELIGYVSDEDYLFISSNLKQHADCFSKVYKNWDQELFESYVEKWNLPLKKKTADFSKGMKTKAMLALTLAHHPKILILDEPTSGLDPVARIEVLDILREFVSDGEKAVLFSTHITGDLDKIADYITILIDGKLTESMAIDKIEEKYAVISGDNSSLDGNTSYAVGIRKGSSSFEALVKRENINRFKDVNVHTPNIENILTFSIWGNNSQNN